MHLPRVRSPGGAGASARRTAAELLRPGGPQRADGASGAPAARARGDNVADEAYRAVFLRVHPTGKMVLSLTTEPDGSEAQYGELVAGELGVPPLDVKVVPADTDRFGEGHGFNTSPSDGTQAAVLSAAGKIRDKAQLLAGVALDTEPENLTWGDGAFVASGDGERQRRSPTSPCTRTAPGCCRRAWRAASTPRRCTGTRRRARGLDCDLDLVGDLQRAEEGGIRLHAPVALPDDRRAGEPPFSPGASSKPIGRRSPASSSSPSTLGPPGELDRWWSGTRSRRPLGPRRRSSARCRPCPRRRAPASRRCPRARGATADRR